MSKFGFFSLATSMVMLSVQSAQAGITLRLIDAQKNKVIAGYENLASNPNLNLALLPKELSIEAVVDSSEKANSVRMTLNGSGRTENDAPYALFGDTKGDFNAGKIPVGSVEVVATSYPKDGASGTAISKVIVRLNVLKTTDEKKACGLILHGQNQYSAPYYSQTQVIKPAACVAEKDVIAICNDGTLVPVAVVEKPRYSACVAVDAPKNECADANLQEGQSQTRTMYRESNVAQGQSCQSEVQTRSCVNQKLTAWSGTFTAPSCLVIGGDSECRNARPALAAGVIPTPNNVGHIEGTITKNYDSIRVDGDLKIDDAFVAKYGRVISDFEVNGTVNVLTSNVKVCNFKADSVKIGGAQTKNGKKGFYPVANVVVQDGSLNSKDSGVMVNYNANSAGFVTRIYSYGGSSDGIRVTVTAKGHSQMVTQSYFTEVAKYRSSEAHADLVQTYPVPAYGSTTPSFTQGPVIDGDLASFSAIIKQNFFKSAAYSGVETGIAVNAVWMAMFKGARFEDNYVDYVNRGFWIEKDRTSASNPIYVLNNTFRSINGMFQLSCTDYGAGLVQKNNMYTTGKPVNGCQ